MTHSNRLIFFCPSIQNPAIVLRELGNFGTLGKGETTILRNDLADVHTDSEWKAKSRLSEIVGTISSGNARTFWSILYFIIVLFFVIVAIAGIIQGTDTSARSANEQFVLTSDFRYEAQPNLPYPTCQLKKGLGINSDKFASLANQGESETSLIDYGEKGLQYFRNTFLFRIALLNCLVWETV